MLHGVRRENERIISKNGGVKGCIAAQRVGCRGVLSAHGKAVSLFPNATRELPLHPREATFVD